MGLNLSISDIAAKVSRCVPAENKVVVALARNLTVLLHRIWTTQERYIPFYSQGASEVKE